MCVYTVLSGGEETVKKLTFPSSIGSHCFGFLIIDQNRLANIYAVGMQCGVKAILRTDTTINEPALSNYVLSVPLKAWSTVFLITTEPNVAIS